jgi:uncharacterized membrane protein
MSRSPLHRLLRRLPFDLLSLVLIVVIGILGQSSGGVLRIVFGVLFVFFAPGYALVSALFPESDGRPGRGHTESVSVRTGTITLIERVVLSFGTSVVLSAAIGLVVSTLTAGFRPRWVLIGVGSVTLVLVGVAAVRRVRVPLDRRFVVPYRPLLDALRVEFTHRESPVDAALHLVLIVGIVAALAGVVSVVVVPPEHDSFTSLYLLSENENETPIAYDYPTEFVRGESKPVFIGIANSENRRVNYSVVVELQRIQTRNSSTTVLEQRRLGEFRTRLGTNQTTRVRYRITPTLTGRNLRAVFLLYAGDPPAEPSIHNAYESVHLGLRVSVPNGSNATTERGDRFGNDAATDASSR